MFDATKLLGAMIEHRSTPSATDRLGTALGQGGEGGPGGLLGQLMSQLGGAGSPTGSGGSGNIMDILTRSGGDQAGVGGMLGGLADMAKQALASPREEIGRGNPIAAGSVGALAGTLLGGGRGAIGGGLLAVLGSLAYSALQAGTGDAGTASTMTAQGAQSPGLGQPSPIQRASTQPTAGFAPQSEQEVQRSAQLMLRSMIQAAKADGQIDDREMNQIMGKLHEAGEDPAARDFVLQQMRGPLDIEGLAREARSPKEAAEIYAASLMAIEVDTQAERDYLARLAQELGLSQPTVAYIHQSLGVSV